MTDLAVRPAPAAQLTGLSAAQVRERVLRGETNRLPPGTGRTFLQILRANVVTPFNLLLGALAVAVLATGAWRDALFGLVVVANSVIGVVQEVRATRTLDRLAVLDAAGTRVRRDGETSQIATDDVVLGDILVLGAGEQVAADAVLLAGEAVEVDESLLTGESEHVVKRPGDALLSGSFVVVGAGTAEVTAVGAASFASRMTEQARRYTTTTSELMVGINRILRYVAVALVVVGPVLLVSQHRSTGTWQEAVQGTVAGLVGIVPEGLVLLTSVAFFAAALNLARRRVLVRELTAVEGLARVDVLCVDKTGTLTQGDLAFDHLELLGDADRATAEVALASLAAQEDANATLLAVRRAFPADPGWDRTGAVAFSSARKWSAATFAGRGTWVLGAPEVVSPASTVRAAGERRTLLLAWSATAPAGGVLNEVVPVALVVMAETVRPDAPETMGYFADQGVTVKVLSGDNPRTVAAVARRAGVAGAGDPVDARRLDDAGLAAALNDHTVFGRVVPDQKRAMVGALQAGGHVVAMTGDGVNDALALKDADLGVAMGSGAAATRAVAQLVLLDDQFAVLPRVVAEGRRVIANIERVAALFLSKNVSSLVLSLCVAVAGWPYPFLPRQLTLVSQLAIGVPGFFLALGPNRRRFQPGFVRRVLGFAVPAGVLSAAGVMIGYGAARAQALGQDQARTGATIVFLIVSLWILAIQARPLQAWKVALLGITAGLATLAVALPVSRAFYELHLPSVPATAGFVALGVITAGVVELVSRHPRVAT